MIIRSKAPLRISFGGGGTDVSPYPEEKGGVTLSTTIDKYAYCTLATREDDSVGIQSLDYNIATSYSLDQEFQYGGDMDLVKAVIKVMKVKQGLDLFLHSDAPPGCGLGTSSAVAVTLVGVFKHWLKLPLTDYDVAELAYHIEREEVGIKGGKQDQYATSFGGFNFIEYNGSKVIVNPLRIEPEILNELQYRLMLCYTGKTRLSAGIIDDQMTRYQEKKKDMIRALNETKELAIAMKNALLVGQIDEFGSLLHQAWCAKKQLSSKITNPDIDELYEVARQNGAIGGKLLGAGGGGYLLLFCQFDKRHIVAEKLEQLGGKVANFAFDFDGLQTWSVNAK